MLLTQLTVELWPFWIKEIGPQLHSQREAAWEWSGMVSGRGLDG